MICFPNAKINLGLHITERLDNGFHIIESVKIPVGWKDVLEIVPNSSSKEFELTTHGIKIDDNKNNLVYRAWLLLKDDYQLPSLTCHLLKNIPTGAGLGGGSSDGTNFLLLANKMFELGIATAHLESLASKLGSDCPFFVQNQAVVATGTGTSLAPISLNLSNCTILIVHPGIHVSTKWAYNSIAPRKRDTSLGKMLEAPMSDWMGSIVNDFEAPIFSDFPEIQLAKHELLEAGAVYASMSGSGSAVYGIFNSDIPTIEWPTHYKTWSGPLLI